MLDQPITAAELAELRAAAEKATPRPWVTGMRADEEARRTIAGCRYRNSKSDVPYIVAACNLAPRLIAEVERLQGELDATQGALDIANERFYAYATGVPLKDGTWSHLGICSGSHKVQAGTPGSGCCCDRPRKAALNEAARLRAALEQAKDDFREVMDNCGCCIDEALCANCNRADAATDAIDAALEGPKP